MRLTALSVPPPADAPKHVAPSRPARPSVTMESAASPFPGVSV